MPDWRKDRYACYVLCRRGRLLWQVSFALGLADLSFFGDAWIRWFLRLLRVSAVTRFSPWVVGSSDHGFWMSLVSPGATLDSDQGPIWVRIRRNVGWPIAAVIRRTWRFLPSVIDISNQLVGMFARNLTGGVLGHNQSGVLQSFTFAGLVFPSLSAMPFLNVSIALSSGMPSTWTIYVFCNLLAGWLMRLCSFPSSVNSKRPSLSRSRRPAG